MAEASYECKECDSDTLLIIPTISHGWIVKCGNSHERFPMPGQIIKIKRANESTTSDNV